MPHPDPVLMCGCADWLTCEHPWPVLFPTELLYRAKQGWNVIEGDHFTTDRDLGDEDVPAFGVYSGQGDEA